MERELLNAAVDGSVQTLMKLLHQDQLILRRYIARGFKETPLHVAAMFGHLEFIKAVLAHMPEMAKELDDRKSTPLHVATANGHILVVKELLSVSSEMCFAKDWEGKNSVHMAVMKGHIEILKELALCEPQAAKALLGTSTILHLCVKHYQEGALKYLMGVFSSDAEFINFKDEEGFTILHLAVAEKQIEVVKFLLRHPKVDVNATNAYGFTALDMSLSLGRKSVKDTEVVECFRQVGELGAKSSSGSKLHSEDIICNDLSGNIVAKSNNNETRRNTAFSKDNKKAAALEKKREMRRRLENSCNTMMIVASLIATVSFEALIEPPAKNEKPVDAYLVVRFMICNTLSFSVSTGIILLLISGLPLKHRFFIWLIRIVMWIAVLSSALTYVFAMYIVTEGDTFADELVHPVWIVLIVMGVLIIILMLGNVIQMLFKMVRYFLRRIKKRIGRNSNAQNPSSV